MDYNLTRYASSQCLKYLADVQFGTEIVIYRIRKAKAKLNVGEIDEWVNQTITEHVNHIKRMNKPNVGTPGGPDDVAPIQAEITNAEIQTFQCRFCDIEMAANEMKDLTQKETEKIIRSQIKVLKSLGLLD